MTKDIYFDDNGCPYKVSEIKTAITGDEAFMVCIRDLRDRVTALEQEVKGLQESVHDHFQITSDKLPGTLTVMEYFLLRGHHLI